MRTAEASLAVVAAVWVAAGAAGCGAADGPTDPTGGAQVSCIYGGTPAPTELALTAAETNALADLDITGGGEDSSFGASCTGLLVGDGWVLTAAHCTRDPATTRVTARFGPPVSCQSPRRAIASAEIVTHPSLDLMLVRLAETPAQVGIQAAPVRPHAGEDLHLGDRVQLAGFGWTEDSSPGQLRFVAEAISALDETWMEVDGRGASGACVADSGGPLLWRDAAGVLRTAAVLSAGSADCVGVDRYVRLRSVVEWLAASGV
jgi:hypothetical protein